MVDHGSGSLVYSELQCICLPFSVNMQKERAKFVAAKKKLRDLNIKYSIIYPSMLRVAHNNMVQFFHSTEDIFRWIEQHGLARFARQEA